MNSGNGGDYIVANCKESEDYIIVTNKSSPERCKLRTRIKFAS